MNEAYPPTAGSELWTVFHSDGDEAGLTSRKFATEAEARAKCDEWNKTYPGHIVIVQDLSIPNSAICVKPEEEPKP